MIVMATTIIVRARRLGEDFSACVVGGVLALYRDERRLAASML
jgi:hypothetical protein